MYTPETLRALGVLMSAEGRDLGRGRDIVAAANAWEAERTTRHMEAAKFLSQIAAWKTSCKAAEKRLEAAMRALQGNDAAGLYAALAKEDS